MSEWKPPVPVLFVPQRGQSNHTPNLFLHQSFIPQLRDSQTGGRGIHSLLGQDYKLIAIPFVVENERDEDAVPDALHRHDAILGAGAGMPEWPFGVGQPHESNGGARGAADSRLT